MTDEINQKHFQTSSKAREHNLLNSQLSLDGGMAMFLQNVDQCLVFWSAASDVFLDFSRVSV
jgi:hypothetical protein